jgi:hypothetical protein
MDAMDVEGIINDLKESVIRILGRAIRIAEHPHDVGMFIEASTEITQTNLLIVVEFLLGIRVET